MTLIQEKCGKHENPDTTWSSNWKSIKALIEPSKDEVQQINDNAEPEIDYIIKQIKNFVAGDFMKNKLPYPLAKIGYNIEYDSMRKTKHFSVEDSCIGCGLCAKNCLVSAIKLKDHKPEWIKEQCVMCLSCLHHCPKFAIQYGKNTKKHGQYTHPWNRSYPHSSS